MAKTKYRPPDHYTFHGVTVIPVIEVDDYCIPVICSQGGPPDKEQSNRKRLESQGVNFEQIITRYAGSPKISREVEEARRENPPEKRDSDSKMGRKRSPRRIRRSKNRKG